FQGALRRVGDIADRQIRTQAVSEIAMAASQEGKFDLAEQIARSISDMDMRDRAFVDLALDSREAGQFEFSRGIALAIHNDVARLTALADLGSMLDEKNRRPQASELFAEATRIAETLPSNNNGLHGVGALELSLVLYNTRDEMLGYI